MAEITRRFFFQSVASALPAVALSGCDGTRTAESIEIAESLPQDVLHALGEAVLPSELGPQGIDRVVVGFQTWVQQYQPVAELNHGYGTGEIEYTPADPTPGWGSQLRALDLEAQKRYARSFVQLTPEARREMIRGKLAGDGLDRLPTTAAAQHVAVGLLAYFYDTSEATDLCYQAEIRRYQCRPLSLASQKPASLQRRM